MAEINSTTNDRRRAGTCPKKHTPKTDMTPMVDLGFFIDQFFCNYHGVKQTNGNKTQHAKRWTPNGFGRI